MDLTSGNKRTFIYTGLIASKSKFEQVPFEFASDPRKATFVVKFEFKSPDLVIRVEFMNNRSLGAESYTRVKS